MRVASNPHAGPGRPSDVGAFWAKERQVADEQLAFLEAHDDIPPEVLEEMYNQSGFGVRLKVLEKSTCPMSVRKRAIRSSSASVHSAAIHESLTREELLELAPLVIHRSSYRKIAEHPNVTYEVRKIAEGWEAIWRLGGARP